MNFDYHTKLSLIKSAVRIVACLIFMYVSRHFFLNMVFAGLFIVAEIIGILEEFNPDKK